MPIEIREIVTEVVVRGADEASAVATATPAPADRQASEEQREQIVRQAVERVLGVLRREWER